MSLLIRYPLWLIALVLVLLLSACASVHRNPLPEGKHLDTRLLGMNDLRFWGDSLSESTPINELMAPGVMESRLQGIMHREHSYLVISGGGENGAYGAGLLVGWSKTGTRPEFTMVTGISTGALTAPFAFLGSDYDAQLQEVYTTLDSDLIFKRINLLNVISTGALLDTTPLADVIARHVDDAMIAAIAREYARGRQLLIGTTNLDAGRPVIWNITRIAATKHPDALEIIRKILLASASLPGVFPPVYFEVETADGEHYDEMHVDGGATSQMFFYPSDVDWDEVKQRLDIKGTPTLYIIRNSRVKADYKIVKPRLSAIAGKTVSSLIRTQGIGDFYRILALAERDGLEVRATWIPLEAVADIEPQEPFDPDYMKPLFNYGYQRMLSGEPWVNPELN